MEQSLTQSDNPKIILQHIYYMQHNVDFCVK